MTRPISLETVEKLNNLYYEQKNFFGRDRLYKLALSRNIDVTRAQVMEWLKSQELYQRFKRTEASTTVKATVLKHPNIQIGIDLIDMQNKQYKGYNYILTAIDLFSKKAFACAMKNKTDGETAKCMKKILKQTSGSSQIKSIRSDNGPEFKGSMFTKLIKEKNIKHIFSLPYKPQSNGNIERFNGTLKRLINQVLKYNNSQDWVSVLDELVDNYNNTIHDTTKITPNDVDDADLKQIRSRIKKKVENKMHEADILNVGDKVRIKVIDQKDGTNWSRQLYTIAQVYRPRKSVSKVQYVLEGDNKKYYYNDLQKIVEINNSFDEEKQYEISKIVKPAYINKVQGYYEMERL